ncbi:helix-turn-helix domain-containing protein [Microbacterium sp.]|uniref:AraC family transcriptional regulator n=1 Tax=Microbacterium sp. TaxID=51671 RepID=UPI003F95B364
MKIRDTLSDAAAMVDSVIDGTRGVLYPARMPQFHRLPPPDAAAELVGWFWIPEWDIEPGRTSRQHIVAFPALNLVVERRGVELVGAATAATYRDLTGRGWAVGAMLRPAAVAALTDDPAALLDTSTKFDAPELHGAVTRAMRAGGDHRHADAVRALTAWLVGRVGEIGPVARQANEMSTILMGDDSVTRAEDVAARLSMSLRTLQRLAHRHVGLAPSAMIRRRRLQEAAQRIREHPGADLAAIAAELGYADHAHLTNDFRVVLGITPRSYRSARE